MATAWIAMRCGEGAKRARRQYWTYCLVPVTKPSRGAAQPGGPSLQRLGRCRALARDALASRRSTLLAQAFASTVQAMAIAQTGY